MKPIKQIAGEILLYFYTLQRKNGSGSMESLVFLTSHDAPLTLEEQSDLSKDLLIICNDSAPDLYNALLYLKQRSFVSMGGSEPTGAKTFNSFVVASSGIDIIEGIERGSNERNNFFVTFNIKVENNVNVESLLRAELGSIFKGSLF
jgi:hypothetical protein